MNPVGLIEKKTVINCENIFERKHSTLEKKTFRLNKFKIILNSRNSRQMIN